MDTKKILLDKILKNMFSDTVIVKYWDGEEKTYGSGKPKFKLFIGEDIGISDAADDYSVIFGEAYMNGKVEIEGDIKELVESIYNNKESFLNKEHKILRKLKDGFYRLKKSRQNIEHHYDIGNDFYKLWLDKSMTYSCAYFKEPDDTLEEAQIHKVEHVLNKLSLKKGQRLLDIGCGWGTLIIKAAKEYGVKCLGITLSREQYTKTQKKIKEEGLESLAEVRLEDYRELKNEKFDRIVSIGMLEHVGKENLDGYFKKINELLKDNSLSLVHSITGKNNGSYNEWINKYIFPGGYIPGIKEIITDIAENNFMVIDLESLRLHYARTLKCWADNFEKALDIIRKTKDETFIRMWRLYLNSCSASFQAGNIDIHQILFSKGAVNTLPWTREYME